MSLFGHPTDLNRQFIARPDSAKEDILYKWPDMTIRKLTQVTAEPDETALFFKEGNLAGPETGLAVGLRVFGEYAMMVSDPTAMILKLVGTRQASNDLITDWAREQLSVGFQRCRR